MSVGDGMKVMMMAMMCAGSSGKMVGGRMMVAEEGRVKVMEEVGREKWEEGRVVVVGSI